MIYFDLEENGIKSLPYKSYSKPDEFIVYGRDNGVITTIEYTGIGATGFSSQSIVGDFSPFTDFTRGVAIADFDNDGDFDIVSGGSSGGTFADLKFFEQTTSMNFIDRGIASNRSIFANSYTMDLATGDFNEDGNMDIIFSGNTYDTYFLPGLGDGTFANDELIFNTQGNGRGKDAGDFDNDGKLDFMLTMSGFGGDFFLFRGLGDGLFAEIFILDPPSYDGHC